MTGGGGRARGRGEPPEQVLYADVDLGSVRRLRLEGSEADHARRSLRLRSGDPVSLVNGRGDLAHGRVGGLGRGTVEVDVDAVEVLPVWPRRTLWLAAGVLRSTRMDFLVEKASELGVSRFVPLVLDRSVARPGAEGTKEDRWNRLAVESLKQSRRAHLMKVAEPLGLEAFLEDLPAGCCVWFADPEGSGPETAARPGPESTLVLLVGPEGGLAPRERARLLSLAASPVRLGGHRLRAETAAGTLVTAALTVLGEMG